MIDNFIDGKYAKLRKFGWTPSMWSHPILFQAFCLVARQTPKESFVYVIHVACDLVDELTAQSRPRNVLIISKITE